MVVRCETRCHFLPQLLTNKYLEYVTFKNYSSKQGKS